MDTALLFTTLLFLFFLGPAYAWGLLHFFRYNFQWHLASMVGISSTVSLTGVLVWSVRGIPSWEQAVIDLAIVFTAASPWMALVGWYLNRDKEYLCRQINTTKIRLNVYQRHLEDCYIAAKVREEERQIMLIEIKRLLEENQKSDFEILQQALAIIGLRQEAERILSNRRN